MSFQSIEVATESSNASLGRQWRDTKSEFERDIMHNVQQMQESALRADNTLHMASKTFLSKAMDCSLGKELRTCRQLEQSTLQIFRDWTVHMAGEPLERHRKRFACDKLRKAFDDEVACVRNLERRATLVRNMPAKHVDMDEELGFYRSVDSDSDATPPNHPMVPINGALMDRHEDVRIESEMVLEREEGIKRVQTQMASVNQIFRDLASIVTEQGRQIETIEQYADESGGNTKQATEELQKACKRKESAAHLWLFILAVTLFICISILIHMFSASPSAMAGAIVIGDSHGIALNGVAQTSGFATGFGTKVMTGS